MMKTRLRMLKAHQEEIFADFKQGLAPAAICGRGLDIQRQEQCLCVQRIVAEADVEEQKDKPVVIFKKAENVLGFYAYIGLQEAKELQTERAQRIPVVCVIGAQIQFLLEEESGQSDAMQLRTGQLFGTATTILLHQLKIGVAGVSGTGSIVAEQLARYGVGQLVLVDDDVVEEKNLNRILNSTLEDADNAVPKVQMFERYVKRSGLPVQVIPIVSTVADPQAIHALSQCDILFGCMDSVDCIFRSIGNLIPLETG